MRGRRPCLRVLLCIALFAGTALGDDWPRRSEETGERAQLVRQARKHMEAGQKALAIPLLEKWLQLGPGEWRRIEATGGKAKMEESVILDLPLMGELARALLEAGADARAHAVIQQQLQLIEALSRKDRVDKAHLIEDLLISCRDAPECVRPLVLRAAQLCESPPAESEDRCASLLGYKLVKQLIDIKDLDPAEDLHARAVRLYESRRGPSWRDVNEVTVAVLGMADHCPGRCDADRVMRVLQRALHLSQSLWEMSPPALATSLSSIALSYISWGALDQAEGLVQRVVQLQASVGPAHPPVAGLLRYLAGAYDLRSEYLRAESLLQQAVRLQEAATGRDSPGTAEALSALAGHYSSIGLFDRAVPLLRRAVQVYQSAPGASAALPSTLETLANTYLALGDGELAEELSARAFSLLESAAAKDPKALSLVLFRAAMSYQSRGVHDRAAELLGRSLRIEESLSGPSFLGAALVTSRLAECYRFQGAHDRAEPLFQRALKLYETAHDSGSPFALAALQGMALLYRDRGAFDRAAELQRRVLQGQEAGTGPNSVEVAGALQILALIHQLAGRHDLAEPLLQRALAIQETRTTSSLAPPLPPLISLAWVAYARGDRARAEALSDRVLDVVQRMAARKEVVSPQFLGGMAGSFFAHGDTGRSMILFRRMLGVMEALLQRTRAVATESHLAGVLRALQQEEEKIYSAVIDPKGDAGWQRLALAVTLLRKGRSVDEAGVTSQLLIHSLPSPEDHQKLERLRTLQSQYAALSLAGPGSLTAEAYRQRLTALEEESERLEQDLAERSAALRARRQLPGLDQVVAAVAAKLPEDGALVEVLAFRPFDFRTFKSMPVRGAPRYLALVLRRDGVVGAADLGPAAALDAAVGRLHGALSNPRRRPIAVAPSSTGCATSVGRAPAAGPTAPDDSYLPLAQEAFRLVMKPLLPLLGGRRDLHVSLDGQLHLLPLAALHDEQGPLIDRYRFTYLTSGRDLLRQDLGVQPSSSVVVFADPDFGAATGTAAGARGGSGRGRGLCQGTLSRLPGTRREAEAIARLWPTQQRMDGLATEPALLALKAPGILHVATHGCFLEDASAGAAGSRDISIEGTAPPPPNPLLRSALVLAGAWQRRTPSAAAADGPDGMATALEVAGMDLWGTQLVVLSACDTGRGIVRLGQGVYGLRRAVMVAGAETLVTSLWKVNDQATGELMQAYYDNLRRGAGRAEGMRSAALSMRARYAHPYYWAPFIVLGRPDPLRGMAGPSRQ